MMSMERIETGITEGLRELSELLVASATYIQIGTILGVYVLSFFLANQIKHKSVWVSSEPHKDIHPLRKLAFGSHLLVFPLLAIIVLKLILEINAQYQYES